MIKKMLAVVILLGLITQLVHNVFDLIGLKHYFHDQVEVELVLTLSVFFSIWEYFKPILVSERYKKSYQIFLTNGALTNMIVAIILTVAELLEMMEEDFHFLQGLLVFVLLNSIVSLLIMTLKYKNEFVLEWKKIFLYELIFVIIATILNFFIEPIFELMESIGFDLILYISVSIFLIIWKYNYIIHYWKTKKILVISVSSIVFLLMWQLGLLGF